MATKGKKAQRCDKPEMTGEAVKQKPGKQEKRIMQPGGCRSYMRRELAREFEEIVKGFVDAAKRGSCMHVKLATELLKPTRKGTTRRKGTAQRLLEELGRD